MLTKDERWAIWESRDAAYDGRFFVAVRTTGVYCRPSCPARPLRKNVVFFDSADAAESAGFRACKRCHPRAERAPAQDIVARVTAFIAEHGHARLEALSASLGYSPFHVQRVFKQALGVSPLQYAKARRARQFKQSLAEQASVTTAMLDAGINSSSQLYAPDASIGMTPAAYKSGGLGARIDYAMSACALGRMLVAATRRGLCAVYFADTDAELIAALRAEYPRADIAHRAPGARTDLDAWSARIAGFVEGDVTRAPLADLPLDVQGTAFQAQVWQALRDIPSGETRSYSEVARAIGRPTAMRAVANACGANRVAVVIPCHRVVREDGAGGYRWGVSRKAALLARERVSR
jgi:AraC family transcriptional regulator of adaptative response/methylated-DNA-[protein]-cysteine methyltransferase